MKFGRQQDWIKQIHLARKKFLSGVQSIPKRQPRINNSLRAWLITGTEAIEEQSDEEESLRAINYETSPNTAKISFTATKVFFARLEIHMSLIFFNSGTTFGFNHV